MNSKTSSFITFEEVINLEKGTVLVNSNWMYWQLSEFCRNTEYQDKVVLLINVLSKVSDEKKKYFQMDIVDVKSCFSNNIFSFPFNMFMRCNE